jgi:hypothetical protein
MGNGITGLLFGIGFGTWVFALMMKQTGGILKTSLIAATIAGLIGFFVIFTILGTFFS